ncbi:MAG: MBOAT family O-acyltransferase [Algibacter sp.]
MVFNSLNFIWFLIPVLFLYWGVFNKKNTYQNILLIVVSIIFYAIADWRFLALLIGSVIINYGLAIKIDKWESEKMKQRVLYLGVVFNVILLLYFKYFNFFLEGFTNILKIFGVNATYNTLSILLPLGISFFTFQTIGYLIDVYNEDIEPSNSFLQFSVFITFFPKILSGPIERASNLMPQIKEKRILKYEIFVDGLRQILWGLFAKVVVAENCATIVNPIFNNYENESGSVLLIGAFFYAIQLYADFSGYSNMAIGVSKLFGFQLMRNFSTPFYSTNISDFWRKWHMSLTSWMMDYVFTPLSFNLRRFNKMGLIIAIITTFILVGFWHGANYTYIIYGLLHGLYFIPLVVLGKMNNSGIVAKNSWFPSFFESIKMLTLFIVVMLTDIFFRADNLNMAFSYLNRIFKYSLFDWPVIITSTNTFITMFLVSSFMLMEWINRKKRHDFEIENWPLYLRWISYISLFFLLLFFGKSSETFIYFQF